MHITAIFYQSFQNGVLWIMYVFVWQIFKSLWKKRVTYWILVSTRDHPYISSAYFWTFFDPPTHNVSINTIVNKNGHFLTPPTQSFCWRNIGMAPYRKNFLSYSFLVYTKQYIHESPLDYPSFIKMFCRHGPAENWEVRKC